MYSKYAPLQKFIIELHQLRWMTCSCLYLVLIYNKLDLLHYSGEALRLPSVMYAKYTPFSQCSVSPL